MLTGNMQYFDTISQTVGPEHVMASGALPPGLPPVLIDGKPYWDGGLVSNTPLQHVLERGGPRHDMVIFQIDLFSARGDLPKTLFDVGQREKEIRYSSRTRLNTDIFCELQAMRRAIRHLRPNVPTEFADNPHWRLLDRLELRRGHHHRTAHPSARGPLDAIERLRVLALHRWKSTGPPAEPT